MSYDYLRGSYPYGYSNIAVSSDEPVVMWASTSANVDQYYHQSAYLDREHCNYCGGNTKDDARGQCGACGAPRD